MEVGQLIQSGKVVVNTGNSQAGGVEITGATVPYPKPTWEADLKPERVITSPDDIEVFTAKEHKRFRVGIRRGDQGFVMKVTDGGTRRIRSEVAKAGDGAYYEFDYETQEAVILKTEVVGTLSEYAKKMGWN